MSNTPPTAPRSGRGVPGWRSRARRWPAPAPRPAAAGSRPASRSRGRRHRTAPAAGGRRPITEQRSGAHPDERDPQLLGPTLDRLIAERGWETDAAVGGVMGRWAAIVGPEVSAHAVPLAFEDGELVVGADSTAWATQIRLLAPTLLRPAGRRARRGRGHAR